MRKVIPYKFCLLVFLIQGCYTKLLIPERKYSPAPKIISVQERSIQALFERPFNPDVNLIGSTWESRPRVMMDGGEEIDVITFGQNDQLAFSRHGIARYRIFSDTLIVVFNNTKSIDKYLYRTNDNRLWLKILSHTSNEDRLLVGYSSEATFNRIIR